jgi:hypothetical protein
LWAIHREKCSDEDLVFEVSCFFFSLDVPSLMAGDQGSLVGHGLRIMCGSDEKYKGS